MQYLKKEKIISFTWDKEGEFKNLPDINFNVPSNLLYEIQEFHLPIYHAICTAIENEFTLGNQINKKTLILKQ